MNFANDKVFDEFIRDVLGKFKPTADYIFNKQVMYELYETYYNIHDHINKPKAFSATVYHEALEYHDNYLYTNYLLRYMRKDIGGWLKMSFDEFINRPRYEIELIEAAVDRIASEKNAAQQDELDNLNDNMNKTRT